MLAALNSSMATKFKCDYCAATFDKNATVVETERRHGLWEQDYCMCPNCFKQFKVMLEKAKSQKSWTGWAALEKEVASLKKETKSLKSELQFLRQHDPICDQLLTADPHNELVKVAMKTRGGDTMMAHRSILISRSAVFKKELTSDEFKKQTRRRSEPGKIELVLPTHSDSFRAFIQFLYTAELKPEILKRHAPDFVTAGYKYEIGMLIHKCEDYMVHNMTDESTIKYLIVGDRCNSKAIIEAAAKHIGRNQRAFENREDYKALKKKNPALISRVLQYIINELRKGK